MELPQLTARVRRLEELSRGLAHEASLTKSCFDPVSDFEHREFTNAILDALKSVDDARGTLTRACERLGRRGRQIAAQGKPRK